MQGGQFSAGVDTLVTDSRVVEISQADATTYAAALDTIDSTSRQVLEALLATYTGDSVVELIDAAAALAATEAPTTITA